MNDLPLIKLFIMWMRIGATSFGGGSVTQLSIQRVFVDSGHLSEEEFARRWAISHIPPGLNLFAMCIQIGMKARGWRGGLVSMLGFTLPSTAITILMTSLWVNVKHLPLAQAALKGVAPAVVGLGAIIAWNMLAPLILRGKSVLPRWISLLLAVFSGFGLAVLDLPVFALLIGCGVLGALIAVLPRRGTSV